MESMTPSQFKKSHDSCIKVIDSYKKAMEEGNWSEARGLNQLIYEHLFLTYQDMLRFKKEHPESINIAARLASRLETLQEEGIIITIQQNNQEDK